MTLRIAIDHPEYPFLNRFNQFDSLFHQVSFGPENLFLVLFEFSLPVDNLILTHLFTCLGEIATLSYIVIVLLIQVSKGLIDLLLILFSKIVYLLDRIVLIGLRFGGSLRIDKYISLYLS